jgi:hypothetical protein
LTQRDHDAIQDALTRADAVSFAARQVAMQLLRDLAHDTGVSAWRLRLVSDPLCSEEHADADERAVFVTVHEPPASSRSSIRSIHRIGIVRA